MLKTAFRLQSGLVLPCSADPGYRPFTKLLLAMKLTIVLLTTMMTCAFATGHSQSVTFSGKEVTLQQVFTAIENQTGFVVFSNRNILDDAKPVTITASRMPLTEFLQAVMKDQPFEFLIEGKTIVLSPKKVLPPSIQIFAPPPGRDLPGYVLDEKSGAPIRGVTISIDGTNKATQSDVKGVFTLKGIEGAITITLTCIGYEKKVLKISETATTIMATMKVATSELDEAVVKAYGVTSNRLATGNITKVSGDELRKQPTMNPMAALQGRVPGLLVTRLSGNASSPIKLEIRGRNSIDPNMITEPLYIIDGIPQTVLESGFINYNTQGVSAGYSQAGISFTKGQSPFFNINPRDIESIEILQDADATAIYGSRASNGVVLITTKKSRAGRTSVEFSVQQGIVTIPRYPQMLNLHDYLGMRREAFKNDGITPTVANAPDLLLWDTTRSTNWIKEQLSTGKTTDVSVVLSGGDSRTNFRLSGGYTDQVDLNSRSGGNKRGTVHFNSQHTSTNQKLVISLMALYGTSRTDAISDAAAGYTLPPNAPPIFDKAGNLNFAEYNPSPFDENFPFSYILRPGIGKTNTLSSNLTINYTLLKGLSVSGSLSYQNATNTTDFYQPMASQDPRKFSMGSVILGTTRNNNLAFEPRIDYSRSISRGKLTVSLIGTWQKTNTGTDNIMAYGFTNDDLLKSLNNAQFMQVSNTYLDVKTAAVSANINYIWDQKYILNLIGRRDGSSRFAPGTRYGNFWSVGAGWIASDEKWLQKVLPSWFSYIKLRGSYGLTGSANIGDYEYLPRYSAIQENSLQKMYTYNGIQPYESILPVNQEYRWEEQYKLEGSLELGFMEQRISMRIATYRNRSGNQLTDIPTPYYTGFENVTANRDATLQNTGITASVSVAIIRTKDLRLNISGNISRNKNKLTSFPGIERSPYASRYRVGESLQMTYFLKTLGVNPLTGDYSFEDYNKDGLITSNSSVLPGTGNDDRYLGYDMNPKYFGGIGASVGWKTVDLSLNFSYENKLGLPPYSGISAGRMNNLVLPSDMLSNHWRKPGDIAKYPKFSTIGDNRGTGVVNSSYIRLNSVNLNYSMPEKLSKKAGLQNCMFSLSVDNLFIITNSDLDPEIRDGSFNPIPRTIVARLTFTL